MIRLDRLKISIPNEYIQADLRGCYFEKNIRIKEEDAPPIITYELKDQYRNTGVSYVKIYGDYTVIDLTGKILKGNYFDMININTIEQALENIGNEAIRISNISQAIDTGKVLLLDVTNNLVVNDIEKNIKVMASQRYKQNYELELYKTQALVLRNRNKTSNMRTIFYDKQSELKKQGKGILEYIDLEDYKDVLRCETNIRKLKDIRRLLNIGGKDIKQLHIYKEKDIKLLDVLNSKAKVNYNQLLSMLEEEKEEEEDSILLYRTNEITVNTLLKLEGIEGIIKKNNYDYKKSMEYIRIKAKKVDRTTLYRTGLKIKKALEIYKEQAKEYYEGKEIMENIKSQLLTV